MKNINRLLALFLLVPVLAFAQKAKDTPPLLTIDGEAFSLEEFLYVYNKNNNNTSTIDKKSINEYLDLYVNFRLKVKEAEDRGMDTTEAFVNELAGYRNELARPYLTDKSVDENVLKEAYERLQWNIRASHIMVAVPEDVSDNDSVAEAAYNKLVNIRKEVLEGKEFSEMAKKHSDDPSARDMPASRYRGAKKGNGGDLGYFTAFYMVYPFESAVYNTNVGDVSMPIRTQFGYHIIKVTDKIPALGKIQVKHINVKPHGPTESADRQAKTKIDEIAAKIASGEFSFEQAAQQFSDDKGSAPKEGLLPPFEVSKMVPEFIKAISALEIGAVSTPVKTDYGWHLIKLVSLEKVPAYEEYAPTLKTKVARDSRSNKSRESAIAKFKAEFGFKEYAKNLTSFYSAVDSSIYTNTWTSDKAAEYSKVLFKLEKSKYTQQDFAVYVQAHQVMKKKGTIRYFTDKLYQKWVEEVVLDYKDSKLESQNLDFRMLVQEYHDGILLFAISDEEVWGKAIRDTAGLEEFHKANADKYQWKERVEATLYKCGNDSIAQLVVGWLEQGLELDSINKLANQGSALNLHFEKGKYEPETNNLIDQLKKEKGVSPVIKNGNAYVVVEVHDILEPQNKSLNEARGLITADYQNYLEKQWIEQLNKDHEVQINRALLEQQAQ